MSWPTAEGARPTTLLQFVRETMYATCARVSSGMVSEGHRKEHTSHPLAPSWLTIRSLHSKLVARVVRGWWRLSSSFTSLLAKENKGTILPGVTMHCRNALSQTGCLLAVWSFGATQKPQVVGDAQGKRRSASVMVILCGHPPMHTRNK